MRKKKIIFINALLGILLGISNSIWGQIGVLRPEYQTGTASQQDISQIDLRRGDANSTNSVGYIGTPTTGGSTNVNNEFGAGESATIEDGNLIWPSPSAAIPPSGSNIHTPPNSIQLGSEYSQNIVINTYNAGGYAAGVIKFFSTTSNTPTTNRVFPSWLNTSTRRIKDYTDGGGDEYDLWSWPGCDYITWGKPGDTGYNDPCNDNTTSGGVVSTVNMAGTLNPEITDGIPADLGRLSGIFLAGTSSTPIENESFEKNIIDVYLINHLYQTDPDYAGHWRTIATKGNTPYTTLREQSSSNAPWYDDGILLRQTIGQTATTTTNNIGNALKKINPAFDPYIRPTTVAIKGDNNFNQILVTDIKWWYRWHELKPYISSSPPPPSPDGNPYNWYIEGKLSDDISDDIAKGCGHFGTLKWQPTYVSTEWNYDEEFGDNLLDAAVQILGGASVCVSGDVKDGTSTPGTTINEPLFDTELRTNAMLVFPGSGLNYSLLVGNNYVDLRMVHQSNATNSNLLFSGIPSSPDYFPADDDDDIYLNYANSPTHSFAGLGASSLLRNASWPTSYFSSVTDLPAVFSTTSSVFGVKGNYAGSSNIHTSDGLGTKKNNLGVIEIGGSTQGQEKFHIYSGGVLKNFYSSCAPYNSLITVGANDQAPLFYFDDDETLYILNDGSDATYSGIEFTAVAATNLGLGNGAVTTPKNGLSHAEGEGALHVQAKSYIDIQGDIEMTPGTATNNNVSFLSDGAYIHTEGFIYDGGEGELNIWAKGTTKGEIQMNGPVTITNTKSKSAGQVLYVPLAQNYINGNCYIAANTPQEVFIPATLGTNIQTRIQSDHSYVDIYKEFEFESKRGGALLVQGQNYVQFREEAKIDLKNIAPDPVTADVAIQSKNSYVLFNKEFKYSSEGEGTDLFIDGYTGVTFHGGKIQQTEGSPTPKNIGIQAPRGNVNFLGNELDPATTFAFEVENTENVQVWANNDIDIRSALTYNDKDGEPTLVQFYANDSILTNANWKGAPVTFTATNSTNPTTTDWVAGGNIHTRDLLAFNYALTGKQVGPLTIKSLGGNIVFDRKTEIIYDSENRVLISAEIPCDPKNAPNIGYTGGAGGNRNRYNGNIFVNDLLTITRSNLNQGTTDILAKYNIRTAEVEIDNTAAGNTTNVISDMGDIFLGYSTEPANPTGTPAPSKATNKYSYDDNKFTFSSIINQDGMLYIKSGYGDVTTNTNRDGGGNIYFTMIDASKGKGGTHGTEITIPFSYEYWCGSGWINGKLNERLKQGSETDMIHYEHSGIIGGVGRCGEDSDWENYTGILYHGLQSSSSVKATGPSLIHKANHGHLLVDAGLNGNIIMNTGSELDFQGDNGQGWFRTRKGDIDMRGETNVDGLVATKGLVFLADNGIANKSLIVDCVCDEQFNNVYIQDFDFTKFTNATSNNGSVYFGADNNIKLQYGGLRDIGTWKDPFLSENQGYLGNGSLCGNSFQCNSDSAENKARPMILDYRGKNNGGVGVVASDLIDVYKRMVYYGGATGKGMEPVPAAPIPSKPANASTFNPNNPSDGRLHGEAVAGYGLYIKTQGNKGNWNRTPFDAYEICPPACALDICGTDAYLHQVARVTFHDDARFVADNSKVYVGSPVLEVYGNLDLNTSYKSGSSLSNQLLHIQTDSLIVHDSLILDGDKWRLTTWSSLERNMPIIKLGHQRFTPPQDEIGCKDCYLHTKGTGKIINKTALDTINVAFRNGASLPRLHSFIADHTVLTLLSDSYDGLYPNLPPVYDAKIFTDTFKIRNQVELWTQPDKKREGHLELVSEPQMYSKNSTGIYTRHLHMEPIAPSCSKSKYSELWLPTNKLDVISTSTFGGYGTIHSTVFVEIAGRIAPGYASLGVKGNCYEQIAGTLKMEDLRMDAGAELHYSIGTDPGYNGELADCIEVDHLITRGDIYVFVTKRCGQNYKPGCYPIIRYKTVDEAALNNLKLGTVRLDGYNLALDFSQKGVVQLCVAEPGNMLVQRQVVLPVPPDGVHVTPSPGVHWVPWGNSFKFTLDFFGKDALTVYTDRYDNLSRTFELLTGKMIANGEYEYTILNVTTQPIRIYIGQMPTGNEPFEKAAVWSIGNTLYIKVAREDIASIYSVAGNLVNRIDVPEGGINLTLSRGAYIITLKDGSVHKVIIR